MSILPWLRRRRPRIFVIDDFVPDPSIGAGAPRLGQLLRALSAAGAHVTLWPTQDTPPGGFEIDRRHLFGTAVAGGKSRDLGAFLVRRGKALDGIIVSRPHNLAALRALPNFDALRPATLVYDAEAIFAERDVARRRVQGIPLGEADARSLIDRELSLAIDADVLLAVSAQDAALFTAAGHADTRVLGHAVAARPGCEPFERRRGFLFVGPVRNDADPNSDAVMWFADHVVPRLRARLGEEAGTLCHVGMGGSPGIKKQEGTGLTSLGVRKDLAEVYSKFRVFVAPTRFASGIPLKVPHAAAHGVPAVVTPLLARQLGWAAEREVLVADGADEFADACLRLYRDQDLWERIRRAALARVADDYSVAAFDRTVAGVVKTMMDVRLARPGRTP